MIFRWFHDRVYLLVRAQLTFLSAVPIALQSRRVRRVVLGVILVIGLGFGYRFLFPPTPASVESYDMVRMDQGWTADERERYYQTSQGTLIIPYSWFFALEQPPRLKLFWRVNIDNKNMLSDPGFLSRYRLLPDLHLEHNPDRLPVGITREAIADKDIAQLGLGHKEWISYTCAACHTSQIVYKGMGVRIDGGAGLWDFTSFNTLLANSLITTNAIPSKFNRFADRVLRMEGRPIDDAGRSAVRRELGDFLSSSIVKNGIAAIVTGTYPTAEGFGRMDALGRGANGQFSQLDSRNILMADAPVSVPPLWHTHQFDWVQTPALINQPLGRNITESWGVNANVDLINPDPAKRYASTQSLYDLVWLETMVSLLDTPKWPAGVFGRVNLESAARGKVLYEDTVFDNALEPAQEELWPNPDRPRKGLCARCHAPTMTQPGDYSDGKRFTQLPIYKLGVIGTDPRDAENFANRTVYTGPLKNVLFDFQEKVGIGVALTKTTTEILKKKFVENNVPPGLQPELSGFRPNAFRAPLGYPARPLGGYWSTAPFLHNGSVPNLYQLIGPVSERDRAFYVGNPEYDPTKLGYSTAKFNHGFVLRTERNLVQEIWHWIVTLLQGHPVFSRQINGNSNAGHEFRDAPKGTPGVIGPALTPQQRLDIVEYMKVLEDVPQITPEERDQQHKLLESVAHFTDTP